MAKISTKIELSEEDVLKIIAEKYDLDLEKSTIRISHTEGDAPTYISHTSIIVEGEENKIK